MNNIYKVIAGIGVLIAIFLFLDKFTATQSIISTLGGQAGSTIKTLQGR